MRGLALHQQLFQCRDIAHSWHTWGWIFSSASFPREKLGTVSLRCSQQQIPSPGVQGCVARGSGELQVGLSWGWLKKYPWDAGQVNESLSQPHHLPLSALQHKKHWLFLLTL